MNLKLRNSLVLRRFRLALALHECMRTSVQEAEQRPDMLKVTSDLLRSSRRIRAEEHSRPQVFQTNLKT